MAAKLPNPLMDENPDLHKQIGCMNGIYQLFNRQHFLSGRRDSGHNRKRLPPGIFLFHPTYVVLILKLTLVVSSFAF